VIPEPLLTHDPSRSRFRFYFKQLDCSLLNLLMHVHDVIIPHQPLINIMSDSDSGRAGSVAHAPKARKGQDGRVAKLRNRFEHPMSQALTVVPARRSARVTSAGQLHKTGKRCRSSAQPSSTRCLVSCRSLCRAPYRFTCRSLSRAPYMSTCRYSGRPSGQDQGTGAEFGGFSAA